MTRIQFLQVLLLAAPWLGAAASALTRAAGVKHGCASAAGFGVTTAWTAFVLYLHRSALTDPVGIYCAVVLSYAALEFVARAMVKQAQLSLGDSLAEIDVQSANSRRGLGLEPPPMLARLWESRRHESPSRRPPSLGENLRELRTVLSGEKGGSPSLCESVAATFTALMLPSRSRHLDVGKLALLGMAFATFFLFTSGYHFPGGALHYPNWAHAILNGQPLPANHAQREVGMALLYILSGFWQLESFLGITLFYAAFAVLISLLVYWAVAWASAGVAYYMGLISIVSLAPFTYIKFFYPDQLYMFVNLLAMALLVAYLWSGRYRFLYLFTVAAIYASFTRTAGNLMFPVLLVIAYVAQRKGWKHYIACALIFAAAAAAYQWHRYEIFDMRHQAHKPSGKGMQVLYSTYLYLGDFGYRLSPDIGPNTKRLFDRMREQLQPSVRESVLIKHRFGESPTEFMEKYFYSLTPEELIEKIATQPNEEYYWNVVAAVDLESDQFSLEVAKEIMRAYPMYVVRYGLRNLWHSLFDPGFATPRYSVQGFSRMGMEFPPREAGWGTVSQDSATQFGVRAMRELEYFPLKAQPRGVREFFSMVERLYRENYHTYVWLTAIPILLAWLGALLGLLGRAVPRSTLGRAISESGAIRLVAPIVAASALLVYEDLATALFSQPVYRYFHMTEPWRLVIAGFGVVFTMLIVRHFWRSDALRGASRLVAAVQQRDLLERAFGPRKALWIAGLVAINVALFAWWASATAARTWGEPPAKILAASYGQHCGLPEGNVTPLVAKACVYNRCRILVDPASPGATPYRREDLDAGLILLDPSKIGGVARSCQADFSVSYQCRGDPQARTARLDPPAAGKLLEFDCYPR